MRLYATQPKPLFNQFAKSLLEFLDGCDIGGFNAIRFDIPLLMAEFERAGLAFSLEGRNIVDPLIIFHSYEPRDLAAAYQKYCGKPLDHAHSSAADVRRCLLRIGLLPELNGV